MKRHFCVFMCISCVFQESTFTQNLHRKLLLASLLFTPFSTFLSFPSLVCPGVAYAFAEHEARSLIVPRRLPFLPTPMGKGVLSDAHPLCVSPARSRWGWERGGVFNEEYE